MKNIILILTAILISTSIFAQSVKKQEKAINKRIEYYKSIQSGLDVDDPADTAEYNRASASIKDLEKKLDDLAKAGTVTKTDDQKKTSTTLADKQKVEIGNTSSRDKRLMNNTMDVSDRQLYYKKLENSTVIADSIKGYMGIIHNLSRNTKCDFHIQKINTKGEEKSFMLAAGQSTEYYLLPGEYICTVYKNGNKIGTHSFTVSAQTQNYMGKECHFYLYREGY